MSQLSIVVLATILLAGVIPTATLAQDSSNPETNDSESSSRPLEEITVIGEKTRGAVRYQIIREETRSYTLFNELNNSDEFDIECKRVKRGDTQIVRRFCEPNFLPKLRSQHTLVGPSSYGGLRGGHIFTGAGANFLTGSLRLEAENKYDQLQEEMLRVAMENSKYWDLLIRIGQLQEEYETLEPESCFIFIFC